MSNEAMRQTWAGAGSGWVENESIFDSLFTPFTEALASAAQLSAGQRLLDIGCGSGTLLAVAADAGAQPVGVDISAAMVDAARRRVPSATVVLADAQSDDLLATAPGPAFDQVVSRFGVMFFADPVAAFANIRRASTPGAGLAFACWRDDDNPMFTLGVDVLTARLDPSPAPPSPTAPGPRSFGDPDRVRRILTESGWGDIGIEPVDAEMDFGFAGTDGIEERLGTILAGTTGSRARAELEPRLGAQGWEELLDEVRASLRSALTGTSLVMPGRIWLVTARNPD
ncbi:class I SAM-dependent methyltransferase [Gordonia soli]|uniref:Putative methyltransferase n=1 Tax=Gordonia soli NBRC 108243 TaxID=1223545 RepID=M0QG00_9ACTN|nr:class I SAM-dependent methyltransferase [Gordonia soli]GAC67503.1 putative methyltransferase [Gordonia soli NBRC 108243]